MRELRIAVLSLQREFGEAWAAAADLDRPYLVDVLYEWPPIAHVGRPPDPPVTLDAVVGLDRGRDPEDDGRVPEALDDVPLSDALEAAFFDAAIGRFAVLVTADRDLDSFQVLAALARRRLATENGLAEAGTVTHLGWLALAEAVLHGVMPS